MTELTTEIPKFSFEQLLRCKYVPQRIVGLRSAKELDLSSSLVLSSQHSIIQFKRSYPDKSIKMKSFVKRNTEKVISRIVKKAKREKIVQIVAIGTGTVIDCAKVVSKLTHKKLVVIPTALSCNAFATNKSAIIVDNMVRTVNSKTPDELCVDFSIISRAPSRINYAGLGDILSIHTALYDWVLASKEKEEEIDEKTYAYANSVLAHALENIIVLKKQNVESLKLLFKLLLMSGYVTNFYGSGRPESGSEHIFARAIESSDKAGRVLHGEIVALGVLLMMVLQSNPDSRIKGIIDDFRLVHQLKRPLFSKEEFVLFLKELKNIRQDRYTILHGSRLNEKKIQEALDELTKRGFVK